MKLAFLLFIPSLCFGITCPSHLEVVAAGQSNINPYFFPQGVNGFKATFGATCPSTTYTFTDCGVSGTPISTWQPGGENLLTCYGFTSTATVNTVLWYQGESDCNAPCISNYATLLTNTLNDLYSHFSTPYISYAQISTIDNAAYSCQQSTRDQQASMETATWPMITTLDLTKRDFVHLDDASEYIVGQRFATEILGLINLANPPKLSTQAGSGSLRTAGTSGRLLLQ